MLISSQGSVARAVLGRGESALNVTDLDATVPVNLFEADFFVIYCVVGVSLGGSLIQATVGSSGGFGGLVTNRSGCAA